MGLRILWGEGKERGRSGGKAIFVGLGGRCGLKADMSMDDVGVSVVLSIIDSDDGK